MIAALTAASAAACRGRPAEPRARVDTRPVAAADARAPVVAMTVAPADAGTPGPVTIGGIEVDSDAVVAWRSDGSVWRWSIMPPEDETAYYRCGVAERVPGLDSVRQLSGNCARLADGSVVCWDEGALEVAGRRREDGTPRPLGARVVAPAGTAAEIYSDADGHLALRGVDGVVRAWGTDPGDAAAGEVRGGADTAQIVAGAGLACARSTSGTVSCTPESYWSQIVSGAEDPPDLGNAFAPVPGVNDAAEIDVAGPFACARSRAGAVRCWGGAFGAAPVALTAPMAERLTVAGSIIDNGIVAMNPEAAGVICVRAAGGEVSCAGVADRAHRGGGGRRIGSMQPVPALAGSAEIRANVLEYRAFMLCGWSGGGPIHCVEYPTPRGAANTGCESLAVP